MIARLDNAEFCSQEENPSLSKPKSENLATHKFNILVDKMPWTQSIFHFLYPFPSDFKGLY